MAQMSFGGQWTLEKLEILRRYLDAYATALKNTQFRLIYVDAFTGEGSFQLPSAYTSDDYDDFRELHKGSPRIALEIQDKPFDQLVFIEKDRDRSNSLEQLREEFPERDISVRNQDANPALVEFCDDLQALDRAVVFLDPFATEVSWETMETLAWTEKVDCWILFPVMAISRMMPTDSVPPPELADQLDRIFGVREHWENIYSPSLQLSLLDDELRQERPSGVDQIAGRYRKRLESVFVDVAPTRRTFRNSKNSPMFELFFAASNQRGAPIAIDIADHILRHW